MHSRRQGQKFDQVQSFGCCITPYTGDGLDPVVPQAATEDLSLSLALTVTGKY